MATLEDKILGEKLHNYCSSSEESENESNSDKDKPPVKSEKPIPQSPEVKDWEGTSTNTGPKGVIEDWRRFKQLKIEKREENERERIELAKKLTMTVQSALDEEREKAAQEDPEFAELLNDEFLLEYQKKRMQEMMLQSQHNLKFGELIILKDGGEFLKAIDQENKAVKVIVHIYEDNVDACRAMNDSLKVLAKTYDTVKFCAILGSRAGMSRDFKISGVPALLIYKGGQLLGNFVRLSDDLGNDFCPEDVQGYLVEHGMLEDKTCMPLIIKNSASDDEESD